MADRALSSALFAATQCLAAWLARRTNELRLIVDRHRAEAELRALNDRELADLGLGRGGIPHAARHGRREND